MSNRSRRRARVLAAGWVAVTVVAAGPPPQTAFADTPNASVLGLPSAAPGGDAPEIPKSFIEMTLLGTLKSVGVKAAPAVADVDDLDSRFRAAQAVGVNSFALGQFAVASGEGSTAVGYHSAASGENSIGFGNFSVAQGANSIAFGALSTATGANTVALGNHSLASGISSTAIGVQSEATGANTLAVGNHSVASGDNSVALGVLSKASGTNSTAFGNLSTASGTNSVALGILSRATGENSTAVGNQSMARGANSTAFGVLSKAFGNDSVAFGNQAVATGEGATAIGSLSRARGDRSVAIGAGAVVTGAGSIAIGAGSVTSLANVVSFGSIGHERRLVNIAPGIRSTDAATFGQLRQVQKGLQMRLSRLTLQLRKQRLARGGNIAQVGLKPGPNRTAVPVGKARPPSAAKVAATTKPRAAPIRVAARVDKTNGATETSRKETGRLNGAPDARRSVAGNDGGASAYATNAVASQLTRLESEVNSRFAQVDRRLDQTANGVAMAMALSGSSLPAGKKLAVGVNYGTFGGMSALAVSSHVRVDDNTVVSGGISYGVDQNLVGGRVGMQFAW